jgi:hypothetical protein
MPFVLPQFPLAVSIWRLKGVGGVYITPDVNTVGNLTPGKRVFLGASSPSIVQATFSMELLLPKLTDIRSVWNALNQDMVEVPAGSKRFYLVYHVDDIGKGFPNEHRFALLSYIEQGALVFGFPAPVPLP